MAESNMAHTYGSQENGADLESDAERSGIRSSRVSLPRADADVRTTAKVPRVDLERLLAEEREIAEVDEVDATMMLPPSSRSPHSRDATLRLQAPSPLPGLPSPLGSEFPPPVAELTAVLKYTPPPTSSPLLPPATRTSQAPFVALRVARDDAKRTQRLVVAIWAFALTLAGGLGYFVVSQS